MTTDYLYITKHDHLITVLSYWEGDQIVN